MLKFIATLLFAQVLLAAPFPKQSTDNNDGNDEWSPEPAKPESPQTNQEVNLGFSGVRTGINLANNLASGAGVGNAIASTIEGTSVGMVYGTIYNEARKPVPNPPTNCNDDCGLATP